MVATSIFFIVVMAERARLASFRLIAEFWAQRAETEGLLDIYRSSSS